MIDTRDIVPRLRTLESIALISRVTSTNLVARRVVSECIENDVPLPQAMIIAGEQLAGRGRNERHWSSPAGKGLYTTTLLTRTAQELPLVPLATASHVATFLRETFAIDARIKWPNDILVGGRKIAGILIEARMHENRAYLLIGIGVNVEPVSDAQRPNATSIRESVCGEFGGIDTATLAFIEHMDARLAHTLDHDEVLTEWRKLAIHKHGDPIHCILGNRTLDGTWAGIDEHGRALIRSGATTTAVSAADIMLV